MNVYIIFFDDFLENVRLHMRSLYCMNTVSKYMNIQKHFNIYFDAILKKSAFT